MGAENIKRINRVIEEAFNKGELDVIDEVVAIDYVLYQPYYQEFGDPRIQEVQGLEGYKERVRQWLRAFPDFHMTVDSRIVTEDKITHRFTIQGTHESEFLGIPPTGIKIEATVIMSHHFEHKKVVVEYELIDTLSILQQLGVIEPLGG